MNRRTYYASARDDVSDQQSADHHVLVYRRSIAHSAQVVVASNFADGKFEASVSDDLLTKGFYVGVKVALKRRVTVDPGKKGERKDVAIGNYQDRGLGKISKKTEKVQKLAFGRIIIVVNYKL